MEPLFESSFGDLYDSAVTAFPHTTMRQHATAPIGVSHLQIIPFVGMHTLFLKTETVNEGRYYNSLVLVKGVQYREQLEPGLIEITASDGQHYRFPRPSLADSDVLVYCECADFNWRFRHFNHLDRSLYGRDRKKYEAQHNPGSANPLELPGACKHIMKMVEVLHNGGLFV